MFFRIKNFLHDHKRGLFATASCMVVAIAVALVAINGGRAIVHKEEVVNTSAPTSITFVMPVENGTIIKDFSSTSLKFNSTLKQWEAHKGVDIKGADDAPVLAAYAGEVLSVENTYLNGTIITIRHNSSLKTVYSSLADEVFVKVGDVVKTGQQIGTVSTSAKAESADGNHLHFEVLLNNVKVDPNLYLESSNK